MAEDLFHEGPAPPTLLELLLSKQIPAEVSPGVRFKNTLNGCVLDLVSQFGPMSTELIVMHVRGRLPALRRIDGSEYTEDVNRMVHGCLSISELFMLTETGWVADPHAAQRYRERSIRGILKSQVKPASLPKTRKEYATRKTERLVGMFQDFGKRLRADPETAVYLASPLAPPTGREAPTEVIAQIGAERAAGLVLAYQLLRDNYKHVCEESGKSLAAVSTAEQLRSTLECLIEVEDLVKKRKKDREA